MAMARTAELAVVGAGPAGMAAALAAAQEGVLAGRDILLAGSGPFLLPVAEQVLLAGGRVAAVLEATRPSQWIGYAARAWGHWGRFREAADYLRSLRRHGVPLRNGTMVLRA